VWPGSGRYEKPMALYSTYLPPDGDAGKALFLRDGLSLFGLVLPPLFLAWNRLWLALAVYVAFEVSLAALAHSGAAEVSAMLAILSGLFLFVHGNELKRNRLERLGWRDLGAQIADSEEEAELRHFHREGNAGPAVLAARGVQNEPSFRPTRGVPRPLGLFPE
jgi:hypothetical protein